MKRFLLGMIGVLLMLCGCSGSAKSVTHDGNSMLSSEPADVPEADKTKPEALNLVGNDAIKQAVESYAGFIEEYIDRSEGQTSRELLAFALVHVDEDEVPELVLVNGDSHADMVFFYSFDGENVTELGGYGEMGKAYYTLGKGELYGNHMQHGVLTTMMGHVGSGVLIERQILQSIDLQSIPPYEKSGYTYATGSDINHMIEMTQEEYEDALKTYNFDNREYQVVDYMYLPRYREVDEERGLEDVLMTSLELEAGYPKATASE